MKFMRNHNCLHLQATHITSLGLNHWYISNGHYAWKNPWPFDIGFFFLFEYEKCLWTFEDHGIQMLLLGQNVFFCTRM